MLKSRLWLGHATALAMCLMAGEATSAQMASSAVLVAGRVASFLQPALSGTVTAAIVYRPGDGASEREARGIERALGSGLVVGSLTLRPRRVASTALGELAGARVAFVTVGTDYREVAAAAASRSILTISGDPACTRAAQCVVTISAANRVQITVSRAATRAAKLKFSSAFLMLIKEI
ncbi:hypothetical protein GCM10009087_03480 [Sphingomonas oligophenolica]|uniref:YfiR/HmsC family protein n=1 Tax=Sphingomonas oligophenolica TaxID=301154 RepID=A0ABU9Y0K8_9SPHN